MTLKIVKFLFAAVLTSMIACSPSQQYLKQKGKSVAEDSQYIRVLLLKSHSPVSISSASRMRITDVKSSRIVYDAHRGTIKISPEKVESRLLVESWESPISVQDAAYRGSIEITNVLGSLHVINVIRLEDYLKSVVPSEIPSSWPMESLKAQAVAARTYALYHLLNRSDKKSLYDLDATTSFQVYKGVLVETTATSEAISLTVGEVIINNHKPIAAYFHSTCGGKTSDDKYVWTGEDLPYINSVRCNFCQDSPNASWETYLDIDDIRKNLGSRYKNIGVIKNISFHKKDGRVVEVRIKSLSGNITISGNEFRLLFPPKTIKSLFFTSIKQGNGLKLSGRGWGHGVGMCQWGAKGQAERGISYKKIIKYYYPDATIARLNSTDRTKYAAQR